MKRALSFFSYFENWDDCTIAECCRLGSILEFCPDEVILGSGKGNLHMVYFILDGTCKIIHHINASIKSNSYGKCIYKLYETTENKISDLDIDSIGFNSILFNQKEDFQKILESEGIRFRFSNSQPYTSKRIPPGRILISKPSFLNPFVFATKQIHLKNEEINCRKKNKNLEGKTNASELDSNEISNNNIQENENDRDQILEKSQESVRKKAIRSVISNETDKNLINEKIPASEIREPTYDPDNHIKVLHECKAKYKRITRRTETGLIAEKPKNVKSLFMQVGLLRKGACFGLEKNPKEVFILSETKVKCLMIPRRFLIQHNSSNIWNRIQLFFELYLPKSEDILNCFVSERRWTENKREETLRIVSLKNITNYTLNNEVPFSIRLVEPPFNFR